MPSPTRAHRSHRKPAGHNAKADLWSLGITAIELAEKQPPNSWMSPLHAVFMIPRIPPPTLKQPERWSAALTAFVAVCLTKDSRERVCRGEAPPDTHPGPAESVAQSAPTRDSHACARAPPRVLTGRQPSADELMSHEFIVEGRNAQRAGALRQLVEGSLGPLQHWRHRQERAAVQRQQANDTVDWNAIFEGEEGEGGAGAAAAAAGGAGGASAGTQEASGTMVMHSGSTPRKERGGGGGGGGGDGGAGGERPDGDERGGMQRAPSAKALPEGWPPNRPPPPGMADDAQSGGQGGTLKRNNTIAIDAAAGAQSEPEVPAFMRAMVPVPPATPPTPSATPSATPPPPPPSTTPPPPGSASSSRRDHDPPAGSAAKQNVPALAPSEALPPPVLSPSASASASTLPPAAAPSTAAANGKGGGGAGCSGSSSDGNGNGAAAAASSTLDAAAVAALQGELPPVDETAPATEEGGAGGGGGLGGGGGGGLGTPLPRSTSHHWGRADKHDFSALSVAEIDEQLVMADANLERDLMKLHRAPRSAGLASRPPLPPLQRGSNTRSLDSPAEPPSPDVPDVRLGLPLTRACVPPPLAPCAEQGAPSASSARCSWSANGRCRSSSTFASRSSRSKPRRARLATRCRRDDG